MMLNIVYTDSLFKIKMQLILYFQQRGCSQSSRVLTLIVQIKQNGMTTKILRDQCCQHLWNFKSFFKQKIIGIRFKKATYSEVMITIFYAPMCIYLE